MKILRLKEKIYTGTACGACDKYEVCCEIVNFFGNYFSLYVAGENITQAVEN